MAGLVGFGFDGIVIFDSSIRIMRVVDGGKDPRFFDAVLDGPFDYEILDHTCENRHDEYEQETFSGVEHNLFLPSKTVRQ